MNVEGLDTALKVIAALAAGFGVYVLVGLIVNRINTKSQAESLREYYRKQGSLRSDDPAAANPGRV